MIHANKSQAACDKEIANRSLLCVSDRPDLSTLEVFVNQLRGALGVVLNVVTQGAVVKCPQLLNDAINHVA